MTIEETGSSQDCLMAGAGRAVPYNALLNETTMTNFSMENYERKEVKLPSFALFLNLIVNLLHLQIYLSHCILNILVLRKESIDMTLFLFIIGLIFLILAIISLGIFNKRRTTRSSQERAFFYLLLSIACLGLCIATYVFRLKII